MTKPAQATIAFNHPVAGDNQWNGVPAIGIPNSPEAFGMANRPCDFLVGSRLALRNFFHFHLQPVLTPTPELCKVQGFVLPPTWCRASPSPVRRLCRNWGNRKKCHAELGSASNKIKDLRDPEIVDPELDSGHGSG